METYILEASKYTPKIEFVYKDKYLRIEGDSYPENAMSVYQPLIERIDDYFRAASSALKIDLLIGFINTSSSKMITDIISKLQDYHVKGHNIQLTWFYPEGDIDLRENCELFLEDVLFPYAISELKD